MTNLKNRSIAGTAAMLATMITIAAATPVRAETVSIPVSYSDIDISTPSGAAVLRSRISNAADRICGVTAPVERLRAAACRQSVLRSAHAELAARQEAQLVRLAAR